LKVSASKRPSCSNLRQSATAASSLRPRRT
jgi:hypothetical protein